MFCQHAYYIHKPVYVCDYTTCVLTRSGSHSPIVYLWFPDTSCICHDQVPQTSWCRVQQSINFVMQGRAKFVCVYVCVRARACAMRMCRGGGGVLRMCVGLGVCVWRGGGGEWARNRERESSRVCVWREGGEREREREQNNHTNALLDSTDSRKSQVSLCACVRIRLCGQHTVHVDSHKETWQVISWGAGIHLQPPLFLWEGFGWDSYLGSLWLCTLASVCVCVLCVCVCVCVWS